MAARTSFGAKWDQNLYLIARLYIEDRWSHVRIAEHLAGNDFPVAANTIKTKLSEWGIRRFTPEEELELMAGSYLQHQQNEQQVTFRRWGLDFPLQKVLDYIQRMPSTLPSAKKLPPYFEVVQLTSDGTTEPKILRPHEIDSSGMDIQNQSARILLTGTDQDTERQTKKRKHATLATGLQQDYPTTKGVRRSNEAQASMKPQDDSRNDNDSGEDNVDVDVDSDVEEIPSAQPKSSKLIDMRKAMATIKILSRELGVDNRGRTAAIKKLEGLIERAEEIEEDRKQEEMRTDLGSVHLAAWTNNAKILRTLFLNTDANVNARGHLSHTALHLAAQRDALEALGVLLEQKDVDIDAVEGSNRTALQMAIRSKSLRCALLLVRCGADVNMVDNEGLSALHLACSCSNMRSLVVELIPKTKKIDSQANDERTPLHLAFLSENWDYIIPLLEAKASLNIQDIHGRTPMHQACFKAPPDLLIKLVNTDVDFTIKANEDETILHLLCQRDLPEVLQVVLTKRGVNIEARTKKAITPLILAAHNNSLRTVKLLVQGNADVSAYDEDLDTALKSAIAKGHNDIAEFLIQNKSPVNPQNRRLTHHRAELEQNRKAQEAESVKMITGQGADGSSRPLATSKTINLRPETTRSPVAKPYNPNDPRLFQLAQLVSNMLAQGGATGSNATLHTTSGTPLGFGGYNFTNQYAGIGNPSTFNPMNPSGSMSGDFDLDPFPHDPMGTLNGFDEFLQESSNRLGFYHSA